MILGGVPILVFIPPRIEAKAKGIRNFDGFHFIFWVMPIVIGKSIAIAPMLFIKEDRKPATNIRRIRNWISPVILCFNRSPIMPMNPDFSNALLIKSTNATVITAGCPNPKKASLAGTSPNNTIKANAASVTPSYRHLPHMRKPNNAKIISATCS